ncbi:DDE-type integrase/transposase/recombinase [Paraburkholderia humisilvae]|uniref:DDE-type integrase/transposase/recombinase n=1 Tax=Paraburkholderia humisilvae TaxID=627669 RepID=UPI0015814336|nr:DDE-type integrase/transposase/recombinase [Paraburkholderia humisilvae]
MDLRLRANRDVKPTSAFFRKAIKHHGEPQRRSAMRAAHRAVRVTKADGMLPKDTKVRSSKYLRNLIEQDHRNIKSKTNAMLCFKRFRNATIELPGNAFIHRIRKGQFFCADLARRGTTPPVWKAVVFAI